MAAFVTQKNFWRFWLGGILIFAVMVAINPSLSVSGVEGGIPDIQAAGSAERVDEIFAAWRNAGVFDLAKLSISLDLIFIGIYSFGAFCGAMLFRRMSSSAMRRLGSVVAAASVIFFILDYVETACQFIQIMKGAGSDGLAETSALVKPVKNISFIITFVGILAGLMLQGRLNRVTK